MIEKLILTNEQEKIIKNVGKIGAENATIALSKLTGREVTLKVTDAQTISIDEIPSMIEMVEDTIFSAYTPILGILSGSMMILTPRTSGYMLIDMLNGNPPNTTKYLDRMGESALEETQNIIGNAYLNAMNDFMGTMLIPAVPRVASIYKNDVNALIRSRIETSTDYVITIKTDFIIENVKGVFVLLLAIESLDPMMKALTERIGGGIMKH